jgi:transaldolase
MPTNRLRQIAEQGQSIWLDNLTRQMLQDGYLKRLIDEDGISGVTSNPSIFHKAMTQGSAYDAQIRTLADEGHTPERVYELLAIDDVRAACDLLRPTFERTNGTDGFVSLEVSPRLARDAEASLADARRLWKEVRRPNAFIKIPGTPEGIPAIRSALAEGININITLLFSLDLYQEVMEAHLSALEERKERGLALAGLASVASFFLSRIDTLVDKELDALTAKGNPDAKALRGTAAIASARIAYSLWKKTYSGGRWETLWDLGGRVQKPLWASTSTKDKAYPDVKYVETLIGPSTINTLPDVTIDAFRDHGRVAGNTIEEDLPGAHRALERLEGMGISMKRVTDTLVEDGIAKFDEPYDALLEALEEKIRVLTSSPA